jgi:hypothetical protein
MTFGRGFLIAAVLAVAVGLVAGFTNIGSPGHARLVALDTERANNLETIGLVLRARYGKPGTVAPSRLPAGIGGSRTDGSETTSDPETHQPYEYARIDDTHVKLCAIFALPSDPRDDRLQADKQHSAGRSCRTFDLRQQAFTS